MMREETLYERLGGELGTEKLVVRFYARVLADSRLAQFFQSTSMEKLIRMQHDFFAAALGGPQTDSVMDLTRVHAGRGITPQHFNWFIQHLLTTLEEINVSPSDVQEVVNRISLYKNDITGEAY
jgi:hemoglobin